MRSDLHCIAKGAVRSIFETLDRDLILKQAKGDIMARLKSGRSLMDGYSLEKNE